MNDENREKKEGMQSSGMQSSGMQSSGMQSSGMQSSGIMPDKKEGVIGMRSGMSIPLRDKMIMHLQEQADCKKKQLKEDYKLLKENVKENPYLQVAVEEYDKYFALQRKQLDALKNLLKTIDTASDQRQIKHEIAALEKNLA